MRKLKYLLPLVVIALLFVARIDIPQRAEVYADTTTPIEIQYVAEDVIDGQKYQYLDGTEWKDVVMPDGSTPQTAIDMISAFRGCLGSTTAYFGENYPELKQIRLVKDGSDLLYEFLGWSALNDDGEYVLVDENVVLGTDNITSANLSNNVQVLYATFENKKFDLTISESHSKWTIKNNGEAITFTNNGDGTKTAKNPSNTIINVSRYDESVVSAFWTIKGGSGNVIDLIEQDSVVGGSYYLNYSFEMPQDDVTAVYSTTTRLDTAVGDYYFGTYTINNHESYGIKIVSDEGEKYIRWVMTNNATTAYFTSSKSTDHLIYLDATTSLYLDGVKLTERDTIVADLVSLYSSGIYKSVLTKYTDCHNILIENNPENPQPYNSTRDLFNVSIYLLSDCEIFSIGQRNYNNHVMSSQAAFYSNSVNIDLQKNSLDMFAYTIVSRNTSILKNGVINAITSGDDSVDEKIHVTHTNGNGVTFTGLTLNASGRSLYMRHGGNDTTGGGNGVYLTITNSKILNADIIHSAFLRTSSNTVIEANELRTISYGFQISSSTVTANIMAFASTVHVSYANSDSYIEKSTVTINDWMSVDRFRVRSGSKLTVTNGLHIFESLTINNSEVSVGSINKFRTIRGNTVQDGKHYSGSLAVHYFYVEILNGAKLTVTGNGVEEGNNSIDIGIVHNSVPQIEVYGSATAVDVNGNVKLVNNFSVYDGATVTINGSLVLGQGLSVMGSETTLVVTGDLYHVNNSTSDIYVSQTTDGITESVYWSFVFDEISNVSVAGNLGSQADSDRINIICPESDTIIIGGDIIRDIQIIYTIPDGYENASTNVTNIRLVNNVYMGEDVALAVPVKTGDSLIELTGNCWFWNKKSITGWNEIGTTGTVYEYSSIQIIRLSALAYMYSLYINYDDSSIISIKYLEEEATEWTIVDIPSSGSSVSIPMNSIVEVITANDWAEKICAEAFLNNVYTTIEITTSDKAHTFIMSEMQIMLYVKNEMTLYLDECDIYVIDGGFIRYSSTGSVMNYSGNLIITHKSPQNKCNYTLFIDRNVYTENETVTITGLNIKDLDGTTVATMSIGAGKVANIYLSGSNSIRNILVPSTSELYLRGINNAVTKLANSNYYSGANNSGLQYRSIIGNVSAGKISLIGGKYTWKYGMKDQGSAVCIGGVSSSKGVYLENVEFTNENTSLSANMFSGCNANISILNSTITAMVNSAIFKCADLTIEGNSKIEVNFVSYSGLWGAITNSITIAGDSVVKENIASSGSITSRAGVTFTLKDNASYSSYTNMIFKKIVVQDNATMTILNSANTSYGTLVAANEITISGGFVTCGHIIFSGYVTAENQYGDLMTNYANNTNITSSGVINISGGVVTLLGSPTVISESGTKEIIKGVLGGSRGITLNITGGEISADNIGSSKYVFSAYRTYVAAILDQKFVSSNITISGENTILNDFTVLGGEKSNLTINDTTLSITQGVNVNASIINVIDANINLAEGTILGAEGGTITISGTSVVDGISGGYGIISANNGTINITESSSVHVKRIVAGGGTINISTTSSEIVATDYDSQSFLNVGVYVDCGGIFPSNEDPLGIKDGDVLAKHITISAGACVCAYRVGSLNALGETGSFEISENVYLTANIYGAFGNGVCVYTEGSTALLVGQKQLSIYYDFNVDSLDTLYVSADIIHTYIYSEDNPVEITLEHPYRYGYKFNGWLDSSSNLIESFTTNQIMSGALTASWTKIKVWFAISNGYEGAEEVVTYQSLDYDATSITLPSAGTRYRYYFIGYLASTEWQAVLTSGLKQGAVNLPSNLYTYFLAVNGVVMSDGLTDEEKAILDTIERLLTEEDVKTNNSISIFRYVAQWQTTRVDIIFDANSIFVTSFRFNGILKPLDVQGAGIQKISMYKEEPYSVNAWCTGFIPEAVRLGYKFEYWVSEDGLFKLYLSDIDAIVNENYMTLYAVYTPLVSNNSASAKPDKHFSSFTDGQANVQLYANNSFSVLFDLDSNFDDGMTKYLQLAFGEKLRVNTKITIVREVNSVKEFYYYNVKNDSTNVIDFSSFIKMGYADTLSLEFIDSITEQFIVIVDCKDADYVAKDNLYVTLLVFDGTNSGDLNGARIDYSLLDVPQSQISASGNLIGSELLGDVTIQKEDDYRYEDKELYLVATFENPNANINTNAVIKTGNTEVVGKILSFNKIAFKLGVFSEFSKSMTSYSYSIKGIVFGENSIVWSLAWSNGSSNVLATQLNSQEASVTYSYTTLTSLHIEGVSLDGKPLEERIINKGEHSLEIEFAKSNDVEDSNIVVTLQRQVTFGVFEIINVAITKMPNKLSLNLDDTIESGLYRVEISYLDNTTNENVYYTFVIN